MSYMSEADVFRQNCEPCAGEGQVCPTCGCSDASGACECPINELVPCPHCSLSAFTAHLRHEAIKIIMYGGGKRESCPYCNRAYPAPTDLAASVTCGACGFVNQLISSVPSPKEPQP